ncbi:FAD-dependent monooxygenase, partial [Actinosynnema sp. NPDC023658]|uniref:FAD-dependent monooxygenase n=1 Tax=Actinosynnema sp. NPDC023658 TaxID=3155465 RepID=UPI0033D2CFC6
MDFDVIISGAGPAGLALACELRLHGVAVAVLERLTEPDRTIKAGSVNTPTAEAFYRRGLLPELVAAQQESFDQARAFLSALPAGAGRPA